MIGFILNFPYTIVGLLLVLISGPTGKFNLIKQPIAIIAYTRGFWWARGYMKNARGMALGHVVLLGPNLEDKDLEHELVHVEQHQRAPLVYPFLYCTELLRKGYRNNKYEVEAYKKAGNVYKGSEELIEDEEQL